MLTMACLTGGGRSTRPSASRTSSADVPRRPAVRRRPGSTTTPATTSRSMTSGPSPGPTRARPHSPSPAAVRSLFVRRQCVLPLTRNSLDHAQQPHYDLRRRLLRLRHIYLDGVVLERDEVDVVQPVAHLAYGVSRRKNMFSHQKSTNTYLVIFQRRAGREVDPHARHLHDQ